jgi:hypothetical protein
MMPGWTSFFANQGFHEVGEKRGQADKNQYHRAALFLVFRAALVERIRREIAAGTYETPEKWEAALERLSRWLEVGTLEALDPVGQAGGSGAPVGPSAGHPTGAKSQTFTFERPS